MTQFGDTVANTKSSEKRSRQNVKRRARNASVKTQVRTTIKTLREAISTDPAKAQELLKQTARTINKAASKGVLHAKNASRRIARLTKAVQAKNKK